MALKHIKLPTAIVPIPGSEPLTVRGLSLDDILRIMRLEHGLLSLLFDDVKSKISESEEGVVDDLIANYAMTMVQSAPGLAAKFIVMAADGDLDDQEDVALAHKLPATIQMDALVKIGQLTFALEGGLKKVVETVVMLAKGTTSLVEDLKALPNGSGLSAGK